jgi:hypothetical protein
MSANPYESPMADTEPTAPSRQQRACVDGEFLVISASAVLPKRCVKTNRPLADSDLRRNYLFTSPRWRLLAVYLLLGPLFAGPVYLMVSKRCKLTYGLDAAVEERYRRSRRVNGIIVLLLFCETLILAVTHNGLACGLFALLCLIAALGHQFGHEPLRIVKHRDGRFWIAGCCDEFLAGIEATGKRQDKLTRRRGDAEEAGR